MGRKRRFSLRDMTFDETSAVDVGSNPHSRIVFSKSATEGASPMTTFSEQLAATEQKKIVAEIFEAIGVLDRVLDDITWSTLSADEKAKQARASFSQFVALVQPKLDSMPDGSTVGETAVEKRDARSAFRAVVEKANRLMGDGSPVAGATVSSISKTRSDVDAEVRQLAESRADSRGISVEKAYVEVMKSDGGRLRQQYLEAESDPAPISKTVAVDDGRTAAFSEIEKLAGEHAARHGVSHAVAVRNVSKRRPDLVAKHRDHLREMQAS